MSEHDLLPPGTTLTGKVEAIGKGGQGIIYHQEKPVFLDGVLRDELVEFTITEQKHSVSFGALVKIIESSPHRIVPACPYYEVCGGCNMQHIEYNEQLEIKKDILENNLRRIARLDDIPEIKTVASPPFRYRTRSILKIRDGKLGFFKKESHDVVEIESCLLMPKFIEGYLQSFREHPLTRATGRGEIQVMGNETEMVAHLKSDKKSSNLGRQEVLPFMVGDYIFNYRAENFIQANFYTLAPMIECVTRTIEPGPYKSAVDLFSGTGFFTQPLARFATEVISLEGDPKNLRALKVNMRANLIENVKPLKSDIYVDPIPPADIYLADPPRKGLNKKIISALVGHSPKKILYFSCDSATFARDLVDFREGGYLLKELTLLDNFPQSDHFEIFSYLIPAK